MKYFFVVLSAVIILFSCKPAQAGQGASRTARGGLKVRDYNYVYEKIVFDNYRFKFEFHLSGLRGDKNIEGIIKRLIYNDKALDAYVLYKENTVLESLKSEYLPLQLEEDGENIYQGEYIENINIKDYDDSFVILRRDEYVYYSGQAHGNSQVRYYILDLEEERILSLDDLSSAIPEDILKTNIKSKFNIDFNYRESLWPPDTISFDRESLVLFWDVYSIAPYSTGAIEITIPYNLIDGYLTEKGRLIRDQIVEE
jgi:hypothetical protein